MPLYKNQVEEFNTNYKRWKRKIKFLIFGQHQSEEEQRRNQRIKILLLLAFIGLTLFALNKSLTPVLLKKQVLPLIQSNLEIRDEDFSGNISQKRGALYIKGVEIEGKDHTPFEFIKIQEVKASPLNFNLFNQEVAIETIKLRHLTSQLNFVETENHGITAAYHNFLSTISQSPNFHLKESNISWGYSNYTKGSFQEADLTVKHDQNQTIINLNKGLLTQNFFKDISISSGSLTLEKDQIILQDVTIASDYLEGSISGVINSEIQHRSIT